MPTYGVQSRQSVATASWRRTFVPMTRRSINTAAWRITALTSRITQRTFQTRIYISNALVSSGKASRATSGLLFPARKR